MQNLQRKHSFRHMHTLTFPYTWEGGFEAFKGEFNLPDLGAFSQAGDCYGDVEVREGLCHLFCCVISRGVMAF